MDKFIRLTQRSGNVVHPSIKAEIKMALFIVVHNIFFRPFNLLYFKQSFH